VIFHTHFPLYSVFEAKPLFEETRIGMLSQQGAIAWLVERDDGNYLEIR
jgi:hypothetical protein